MLKSVEMKKILNAIAREIELDCAVVLIPSRITTNNEKTTVEFQNGWKAKIVNDKVEILDNIGEHPDIWDVYKINRFVFQGQEQVFISGIV